MFTYDQIMNMSPKEFAENWDEIADSALKLIGRREMSEDEKYYVAFQEELEKSKRKD